MKIAFSERMYVSVEVKGRWVIVWRVRGWWKVRIYDLLDYTDFE